ncbi:hypothetical protein L2E82_42558 [Cichorium intybus]|uniref:Uncharacterized protein n=1 Tax=Cichorium intybus TaxID=13427 RepID=A0ACB8ZN42_CICIN|nr:hypothetical protein L2E82_42558 [Cichorium intybus]
MNRQERNEWREVRRRRSSTVPASKFQVGVNDPSIFSFFVSNLPGDANKMEIWRACSKFGELVDVYIAGRRDVSGAFFAFVRFANVRNPAIIEKELNGVSCRGRRLIANFAKHPRAAPSPAPNRSAAGVANPIPQASRDSRSFADVTRGKSHTDPVPPIPLSCIREVQDWACKSVLLGEVKNFDTLCNFPSLLAFDGYDVGEIKYLGGMHVVVKFNSDRAATVFKANKCIWLKWLNWVDHVGSRSVRFERIAWIKITGVPLLAWDESNFAAIAGNFGKVIVNANPFWNCSDVEDDWIPFKPFVVGSQSGSEDESDDEDGISDTWQHERVDLEDGEINPVEDDNPSPDAISTVAMPVPVEVVPSPSNLGSRVENNSVDPNYKDVSNGGGSSPCVPDNSNSGSPVGLVHLGPRHSKPTASPFVNEISSSPDFEPGESMVKRRRTKKKNKGDRVGSFPPSGSPGQNAAIPTSSSPSIDLNRCADAPLSSNQIVEPNGSPPHSVSSSSRELDHTIEIGNQVGFQIIMDNSAFLEAVSGGGANKSPQ